MAGLRGFGITNLMFEPQTAQAKITDSPSTKNDLLVYVFVRGGMDGLNMVTPFNTSAADSAAYYTKLRPRLNIAAPNSSATRKLMNLDGKFGLHPDAARGTGPWRKRCEHTEAKRRRYGRSVSTVCAG